MKITKRKDPNGWRVHINGNPTPLLISKGEAPRYREPQMYNLWTEAEDHILEAPGVGAVMQRVEVIAFALLPF